MSNILIIKHGSLGDIAQACGAIQDISENHKDDQIHLLTTKPYFELFKKNPNISNFITTWFNKSMNNEGLNRTSNIVEAPTQETETTLRVNVDVLKQRLIEQKRKEKVKRTIILSTVVVSLGALTVLTY